MIESSAVSLQDSEATRDELEILRNIMRSDRPYYDEAPELPDTFDFEPEPADRVWWSSETGGGFIEGEPDPDSAIKLLKFQHVGPGRSVALVENERPVLDQYRYLVIAYADGSQVDFVQSDSLPTAKAVFAHAVAPLPGPVAREAVVL